MRSSAIKKFFKLPLRDKLILLEVLFLLVAVRIALFIFSFKKIAGLLGEHQHETARACQPGLNSSLEKIQQSIRWISPHMLWRCRCMDQALCAKIMMKRRHIPSTLYLGLTKAKKGGLHGHAWVRSGDVIVTGEKGRDEFAIISSFGDIER